MLVLARDLGKKCLTGFNCFHYLIEFKSSTYNHRHYTESIVSSEAKNVIKHICYDMKWERFRSTAIMLIPWKYFFWIILWGTFTATKVSIFGVFLFRISRYFGWIWRDTAYLPVFSPNAGKCGPEKLRI